MKTVSFRITPEQADNIVSQLAELGYISFCIPGVLQDNYICDLGKNHNLKLGRYKMRNFVLIRVVADNCWGSHLELELTDDTGVYKAWMKHYEDQLKESEGESA